MNCRNRSILHLLKYCLMMYRIIQNTLHIIYVSDAFNVIIEQTLSQFEGKSMTISRVEIVNKNGDF